MFDIFGVSPHQRKKSLITSRHTKAVAEAFAKNLANFGYTELQVKDRDQPTPTPPVPPAPSGPTPPPLKVEKGQK